MPTLVIASRCSALAHGRGHRGTALASRLHRPPRLPCAASPPEQEPRRQELESARRIHLLRGPSFRSGRLPQLWKPGARVCAARSASSATSASAPGSRSPAGGGGGWGFEPSAARRPSPRAPPPPHARRAGGAVANAWPHRTQEGRR